MRVLRDDGRLLLTVPFLAGYHGKTGASASHDEYPDLWRFTDEGLQQLFAPMRALEIKPLYGPLATRLHGSRAWNLLKNPIVSRAFDRVDSPRDSRFTARWLLVGKKCVGVYRLERRINSESRGRFGLRNPPRCPAGARDPG